MSSDSIKLDRIGQVELRQQAHYWRAQHARAVEREAEWKAKAQKLEKIVRQQDATIRELKQQIEALKAELVWLKQQVFGRKTEQLHGESSTEQDNKSNSSMDSPDQSPPDLPEEKRNRGQQEGAKGHGRKCHPNLPGVEEFHKLPEEECRCPICGKPFLVFPGTEDSEEIEWEVVLRRRIHKRIRYVPTCDCRAVPGIVTAPPPAKLIPKGMFAASFWARLIMEKFLFQRPLYRTRKVLALEGLYVSQGTLTGGLKRIGELLQPVYTQILERSRSAKHWKMDETRWLVFAELEGKKGYRWWLWVVITEDTVAYLVEPSRSAKVVTNHLGENPEGIINADRFSAYKALGEHVQIAFCWIHVRRDFIRIRDGYKPLRSWAEDWVKRINKLFDQNSRRLKVLSNPNAFQREDKVLRDAIDAMAEIRDCQLANPDLREAARKALESLCRHWKGCILFVDHPEIPMDNNESERRLRNPVVGRKNYYGSGSVWSGALTAILFTIFQTLLKNNIDPQKWLLSYFDACAQNSGCPPQDIKPFLPWNMSEKEKADWYYQEQPP